MSKEKDSAYEGLRSSGTKTKLELEYKTVSVFLERMWNLRGGFNIPEGGKASDSSEACAKFLAKFYPGHTSRC